MALRRRRTRRLEWLLEGVAVASLVSVGAAIASERAGALSEGVLEGGRRIDPRGLSTLTPHRRRTPSGLLHPYPFEPPSRGPGDPAFGAYAELGWLLGRGDDREARSREYVDTRDGFWIRRFSLGLTRADGLFESRVEGGNVGRDDAFYRLEARRVGRYRLRGHYDALEHVYAEDARVLHSGVGGELLLLPVGLVPGASSEASLTGALDAIGPRRLSQSRNESGVDLRVRLAPELSWLAAYRLDRRDGERLFGGTLGTTFGSTNTGSVVELVEPIHSRTHEWSTGFELASETIQANLSYRASIYDNRRESITWENPFAALDLGFTQIPGEPLGRSALSPDSTSHRLSGDVAVRTPLRGRFTASAAWTRMDQDERLLPATINADLADFGTLSRSHAGARVDTLALRSRWRLRPIRPISLTIGAQLFRRDNDTSYVGLDPSSGSYGYIVEDLAATNRVGAVPFSHRRWKIETDAEWNVSRRSKLGVEFDHEETHRGGRARRETRDDRLRLRFSTRALPASTLRVSYELEKRTGSHYDAARDRAYYAPAPGSPVLAGPARSLSSFRQFDLASRLGQTVDVRLNFMVGPSADLFVTGRFQDRDYGSEHGVKDERVGELNVEATLQPSTRLELNAYASLEWRQRELASINSIAGPVFDLDPGGATFPDANRWSWESDVRSLAVGAGARFTPVDSVDLALEYRFQTSDEQIENDFDRSGGAVGSPATAPMHHAAVRIRDHLMRVSIAKAWNEQISTTLLYRLEHSEIEDDAQRGIRPLVNQNLFVAHRDGDYTSHVVGATATFRY